MINTIKTNQEKRQEKFKKELTILKLKKELLKSDRYNSEIEVLEDLIK